MAADYDELVVEVGRLGPQVLVADVRMPPSFQREGIEAAWQVRKRHPDTGVVILSQYDEPEYAIALLSEGSAGCAYFNAPLPAPVVAFAALAEPRVAGAGTGRWWGVCFTGTSGGGRFVADRSSA